MYKKCFKKFVKLLDMKMTRGFYSYGDKSFSRDPKELLEEIQAETLDIAGWGMVLWQRIEDLKKKL
jgi:glutamate/tyrosine decarboxylase-like PLP-dependent enzyme